MTSSSSPESKRFEFVPLTPLEESFEEEHTHNTGVQHPIITSPVPSLSIVSDDHSTMLSVDHPALSSRDTNKPVVTMATHYKRPPTVVSSLVDPVLHNKLKRYLNGSFDSALGYTTTDITSDTDTVDHVGPPLVNNTDKMTHRRADNDVHVPNKRTQLVTNKGAQSMTYKGADKSTELDNLWQQFLTSPLYTDWVKRSPDAKTGMCKCYCEELKQIEYKSGHCMKAPVKHKVTSVPHTTCSSNATSDNSYTTLYTDTGVQTSPSLLGVTQSTDTSDVILTDCPCVSSHVIKETSPPSSDNTWGDQGSCDLTGSYDLTRSCEPPASLTELSLQEACRLFKKDFISNCRHRQRMIHHARKQREEESVVHQHRVALAEMARECKSRCQNESSIPTTTTGPDKMARPKMTVRQMHEQTKRKWKMLPEVKQRQEEMKKKTAAAINRMNMKLYQQKVLQNLRKKF